MRAYKIIYIGTCEGENKIVSHHLIFHTMQFQNRCKCLKIKEDLLYGKSPTVPAWIIFSSTTAASFKSQDSYITSTFWLCRIFVAIFSRTRRRGAPQRRHGGGVRKVQASPSLAALRKLLVRLWWRRCWEIGKGRRARRVCWRTEARVHASRWTKST